MRKSFLFLMFLTAAVIGLPGCIGAALGAALPSLLIDGGMSILFSLLGSVITGALNPTPAA
jgi:hypothetical protein